MRFLRVCINLTNSSSEICESLNTDFLLSTLLTRVITADPQRYRDAEYPENAGSVDDTSSSHNEDHEKKESRFELHLLCLGLMINFVQESDKVKELVLSSPLAVDIKNVFEKLVAREVYPLDTLLTSRNRQITHWDILRYYSRISFFPRRVERLSSSGKQRNVG